MQKKLMSRIIVRALSQLDALLDPEAALTLAPVPVGEVNGHWRRKRGNLVKRALLGMFDT